MLMGRVDYAASVPKIQEVFARMDRLNQFYTLEG